MTPKITIGLTCYNAADTIARAVEGACAQDWPSYEILVVDDGSTDDSKEVLQNLQERYLQLKVIPHEKNKGFPAALNTLVQNASGEFIAFFDDDDESVPERLTQQYQRLSAYETAHPDGPVFCYTNRQLMKNGALAREIKAIGRTSPEPHGDAVADYLLLGARAAAYTWGEFGSCTLMCRAQTLKDLGGFDEGFRRSAEWDMAVRAALKGAHFIAVDAPLVTQYQTATADKAGDIPLQYHLKLCRKHKNYLSGKGIYPAAVAAAHSRFHWARGRKLHSHLWIIPACIFAPRALLWPKLKRRLKG